MKQNFEWLWSHMLHVLDDLFAQSISIAPKPILLATEEN